MKHYFTKDGINLYDVFKAGVGFGRTKTLLEARRRGKAVEAPAWTEKEWRQALEAALPEEFLAGLKEY